jgi:tetratricopeptide (TPR) repeat protein
MPPRGAVLLLTVAAAIATAVVLAEGRQAAPAPQLSAEIGNALTAGRVDDEVLAIATRAVADAERGSDRRVTAAALEQLGQVYSARGQYPDARGVQERALGLWRDVDDTAVPRVLEQLADSQIRVASFDAAGVTIARLRSIREPERSLQPMAFVRMLELEARLRSRRGEYVAAREDLDDAFAMLASTTVGDDLIASLRDVSGYVAYQTGDIQRATVEYEKALVAARRAFGEEHPAIVPYLGKVAITRSAFGDLASARALRVTAVELARARLPACHPASIYTVNDLAISENDLGNYAESRDLLARALPGRNAFVDRNASRQSRRHSQTARGSQCGRADEA